MTILNQLNRDTELAYRGNKKELENCRSRLQREQLSYDGDMAKKEMHLQELQAKVGVLEKDIMNLRSQSVRVSTFISLGSAVNANIPGAVRAAYSGIGAKAYKGYSRARNERVFPRETAERPKRYARYPLISSFLGGV
jgi:hypothetical protein